MAPASTEPVTLQPAEASFDDHAADFFRKGDTEPPVLAPLEVEAEADVDADTRRARSARRRTFSRHVMVVVALSAVLCIVGFMRSATSASAASGASAHAADAQRAANVVSLTPFVVASAAAPLPSPPASPPAEPAAETAAPAATETAAAAAPGDAPAQLSPVEARAAREDARRALDRGAIAAAIAAATSSVELDPTDADAWLLLGAAYQVAGKSAEARHAFASCSKLAKRGDVSECRTFAF